MTVVERWEYEDSVVPRCAGCGKPLPMDRLTKTRCSHDCGRVKKRAVRDRESAGHEKRSIERAMRVPTFIGVDGEGQAHEYDHRYVLLSVGDRSMHRDGAHLEFCEVQDFLLSCYQDQVVFVGYYLGYDFTQWLRSLPQDRAEMLFSPHLRMRTRSGGNPTPFPVYYKDFEFDLMSGRRWKVRRSASFDTDQDTTPWMYICDAGGFFQMSFVRASDPKDWKDKNGPIEIASPEDLAIIEEGKRKRSTATLGPEMIAYNQAENRVLARMMEVMATGLRDCEIRLSKQQWFGPGQVAQEWMKQHNNHTRVAVQEVTPPEVLDAARATFFGGWFEVTRHGHQPGTTWEYDINSAYPDIHSQLPCLLHGKWHSGKKLPPDLQHVIVRAEVIGVPGSPLGAMLHRTTKGKVLRPYNTVGHFWKEELEAAQNAGMIGAVQYKEWWAYEPCTCLPPMREGRLMYDYRLLIGKKSPQGRGMRLNFNSWYGKCAQSVGNPMFANPVHASLITSGTRVRICGGIATHPRKVDAVVMIATDGLYLDEEHLLLPIGTKLGEWERKKKENLTIVMPGMYWDDEVREKKEAKDIKSRGVNAAALLSMVGEFDDKFAHLRQWEDPWPKVDVHMPFAMVTAKQALQRGDWTQCGRVSTDYVKTINSNPYSKRAAPGIPHLLQRGTESTAYNKSFGLHLSVGRDDHLGSDGRRIDAIIAGGFDGEF